jgi:predicted nuclease of predicted toxin-antitoxin system
VRTLRAGGFDVLAICETSPRATDEAVVQVAVREQRLLVTEDKDFGRLVHASGDRPLGVILVRFPAKARRLLSDAVLQLVQDRGESLMGCFVVVQPGRVRITRTQRV